MQRRRGLPIKVFRSRAFLDQRGNETIRPVEVNYHALRASITPVQGSRAEVPGQQEINIYHCIVNPDLPGVDLWSQVEWNNYRWDVVAPPVLHPGHRRTRHWSFDIRLRPAGHEDEIVDPNLVELPEDQQPTGFTPVP